MLERWQTWGWESLVSCDPAALGWNPRFACCWSLGLYSSLCCLLLRAMKLLRLQRFSVFPLSSTDFCFPNILIKYCCCGLGVSGLGAPPTTSVPQFSFCTEQNMVWKPLLCDSRESVLGFTVVPTVPTGLFCAQPVLHPQECGSEREHSLPVAIAWASRSCLDGPPKDKQPLWPLSPRGENATHLEGTGDSSIVPEVAI